MVLVSIFSSEKNLLQAGKNGKYFFITLFAQKNPKRKNFTKWATRKARAPKTAATEFHAWLRAETVNGVQRALIYVYIQGLKTI